MLFIYYKGNTPQQRFYNIGVKGNSKADKIGFVLPRQQSDLDLDGLTCNLKIENKETGFKDLINLNENAGYDEDTDSLMFGWEMTAKDTQHRTLDLQLEFINGEDEIVFQTMIATIELGETIVAGETLPEKDLTAFKQMESKVVEHDQEIEELQNDVVEINERIDNLDIENMVLITYADLVNLKNGGNLKKGCFYRITDYETTTAQANTSVAQHYFDVIVLALSESELSENAWACKSERDTGDYFFKDRPSNWTIKYCLENNMDRFAWAKSNGKGVIYYMRDTFNNECPYDFKNILITYGGQTNVYTFDKLGNDCSINGLSTMCYNNHIKPYFNYNKQTINKIIFVKSISGNYLDVSNNSFDDGCHDMFFENGGQTNFTFGKNCYSIVGRNAVNVLNVSNNCHDLTIGNSCSGNSFDDGCYNITIGNYSHANNFGNGCQGITLGSNARYNRFGSQNSAINLANNCERNSFGNLCQNINLGTNCYAITFADCCWSISIPDYSYYSMVDSGVMFVNITASGTPSTNNRARYFHIHSGVMGTDNNTRITLTLTRQLAYSTDFYVSGSKEEYI